jgi:hypothetical protein
LAGAYDNRNFIYKTLTRRKAALQCEKMSFVDFSTNLQNQANLQNKIGPFFVGYTPVSRVEWRFCGAKYYSTLTHEAQYNGVWAMAYLTIAHYCI